MAKKTEDEDTNISKVTEKQEQPTKEKIDSNKERELIDK